MKSPTTVLASFALDNTTNGTPHLYLFNHGGYTNGFENAALSDDDHDGMRAWQEWIAGTDPTNATSVLRIIPPDLTFIGVSGVTYMVEYSTNLVTWGNLQTNILGNGSAISVPSASGTNMFFRVRVE